MSYDLWIWDPPADATDGEVRDRFINYEHFDERHDVESEKLKQLMKVLTQTYPSLEDLPDDDEYSPWAASPGGGRRWMSFACVWSAADWIGPAIYDLCRGFGLVLWDPQTDKVVRPPESPVEIQLQSKSLPSIDSPTPDVLESAVGCIGTKTDWIGVMQLQKVEHFLQCCLDEDDTDGTHYWVEYREGSWEKHWGAPATREQLTRAVTLYAAGNPDFRSGFSWSPVTR